MHTSHMHTLISLRSQLYPTVQTCSVWRRPENEWGGSVFLFITQHVNQSKKVVCMLDIQRPLKYTGFIFCVITSQQLLWSEHSVLGGFCFNKCSCAFKISTLLIILQRLVFYIDFRAAASEHWRSNQLRQILTDMKNPSGTDDTFITPVTRHKIRPLIRV